MSPTPPPGHDLLTWDLYVAVVTAGWGQPLSTPGSRHSYRTGSRWSDPESNTGNLHKRILLDFIWHQSFYILNVSCKQAETWDWISCVPHKHSVSQGTFYVPGQMTFPYTSSTWYLDQVTWFRGQQRGSTQHGYYGNVLPGHTAPNTA